jgi:hypothetical protein
MRTGEQEREERALLRVLLPSVGLGKAGWLASLIMSLLANLI